MTDAVALNTAPASDHLIIAISLWEAKRHIHAAAPAHIMQRSASELAKSHARCLHGIAPSRGSPTSQLPELMTTAEVASVLRVDRSTLSRWRSSGSGPRVTWLSSSCPRYQRNDMIEWLKRAAA
jgi:hypothetical protein